jgi:RNase P subunit RPR2
MKNQFNQKWRCRTCGTLLGIPEKDHIEIRYKTAAYTVKGELSTLCRRCNTPNFYDTRIRTTEPLGVSA